MKLLIFDIDGTITHLAGSTYRAYNAALQEIFGVDGSLVKIPMHGRTDVIIFKDYFEAAGLPGDWWQGYQKFSESYLKYLPQSIKNSVGTKLHIGIPELLSELAKRKDTAALALGTGNMEKGAREKIGFFNLNHFFPVGGFGDIHHQRSDIMLDAHANAEKYYQREFALEDCWVIGDTIFDIEGGKNAGMKTMGVATGGAYSVEDLHASNPDSVFENFSNTLAVLKAFGLD